ncbi:hypothetical protein AUJ14_00190 [Candidatus Micrarchaeota archaeon CG1_02_55_22]|nr:MAG: hypothetical protein AUJ14_00190 [Candidatus Micrarchaeota archaeon CG1_02_55_22]
MHFFKYGKDGVLAIVLPPRLQQSSGVRDGDAYELVEVSQGVFLLCRKDLVALLPALLGQRLLDQEKSLRSVVDVPEPVAAADYSSSPVAAPVSSPRADGLSFLQELEEYGYLILQDELSAKDVSKKLESQIKQGLVLGVRGFDKKFYIVSREFYLSRLEKVREALGGIEFTVPGASAKIKESLNATKAVIQVMKDQGELIEKKMGVFKLVG